MVFQWRQQVPSGLLEVWVVSVIVRFPNLPVPSYWFWITSHKYQLHLVSPAPSNSIEILALLQGPKISLFLLLLIFSLRCPVKFTIRQVLFFFVNYDCFVFCSGLEYLRLLLRIIIIIYSFRVFHISVSWWFFTRFWATASLLRFMFSDVRCCLFVV